MSLPIADIRDRLAAQLQAVLVDWHESQYPLELMPYDARPTQHRAWAIAVPTTVAVRGDRQSERGGVARGTQALSTVKVGWTWWLQPDGAAAALAEAYTAEAELVAALVAVVPGPHLRLLVQGMARRVQNGEGGALFLGTVTCEVLHRLPLA